MSKIVPLAEAIRVYRRRIWVVLIATVSDFIGATALFLSGAPRHNSFALAWLILLDALVFVGVFLLIRVNKHIRALKDLTTPVR